MPFTDEGQLLPAAWPGLILRIAARAWSDRERSNVLPMQPVGGRRAFSCLVHYVVLYFLVPFILLAFEVFGTTRVWHNGIRASLSAVKTIEIRIVISVCTLNIADPRETASTIWTGPSDVPRAVLGRGGANRQGDETAQRAHYHTALPCMELPVLPVSRLAGSAARPQTSGTEMRVGICRSRNSQCSILEALNSITAPHFRQLMSSFQDLGAPVHGWTAART